MRVHPVYTGSNNYDLITGGDLLHVYGSVVNTLTVSSGRKICLLFVPTWLLLFHVFYDLQLKPMFVGHPADFGLGSVSWRYYWS